MISSFHIQFEHSENNNLARKLKKLAQDCQTQLRLVIYSFCFERLLRMEGQYELMAQWLRHNIISWVTWV